MPPDRPVDRDRTSRSGRTSRTARSSRIAVGRINGPWGLRGHVKVTPLTSNPERLQPGSVVLVKGEPRRILDVASPKGYPCVLFDGYDNPGRAETLKGTMIEVDEADLRPLPEHEYYVHDLIGLQVVTTEGRRLGSLEDVIRTGANDVYVVKQRGHKDRLIPAIADVVLEVDLDGGEMRIDPLLGLLDDD